MTFHDDKTSDNWQKITEDVLYGMTINGRYRYWCLILMMLFMNQLVKKLVVKYDVRIVEKYLLAKHTDDQLEHDS